MPGPALIPVIIALAGREILRRVAPSALKRFGDFVRKATQKEIKDAGTVPRATVKQLESQARILRDQATRVSNRPIYKSGQSDAVVSRPDPTLTLGNVQVQMPRVSGPGPGTAQRYSKPAIEKARKTVQRIKETHARGGPVGYTERWKTGRKG